MEKNVVSVRLELKFTFNICYMESAFCEGCYTLLLHNKCDKTICYYLYTC